MDSIHCCDNLPWLAQLDSGSVHLAYIDPPFNTGKTQTLRRLKTTADDQGDRIGFGGRKYRTDLVGSSSYEDHFDDFLGFLMPRIDEIWRVLRADGSLFVHLDAREVHYVKVALDQRFGRSRFINEIIWSYDFGGRPKDRWPNKHDTILWYAKDPAHYTFNYDEIDRIPYMAPGLVGAEKAERGKTPTDVWWNTIVPTNGAERTGYPTQKPLSILNRIVRVHSMPGDTVLDCFAGSGTTGEAAACNGRRFLLCDISAEACQVAAARLADVRPALVGFEAVQGAVAAGVPLPLPF
ncbi:MAG: site-specific DNA-methyltransferase [Deltaproteobacteria bacterium]|nr:site-specific DNA-methyltransferase [Deltaproteobacteria bacterium]